MHETKIVLGYSPFEKQSGFFEQTYPLRKFYDGHPIPGFRKSGVAIYGRWQKPVVQKEVFKKFKGFDKKQRPYLPVMMIC